MNSARGAACDDVGDDTIPGAVHDYPDDVSDGSVTVITRIHSVFGKSDDVTTSWVVSNKTGEVIIPCTVLMTEGVMLSTPFSDLSDIGVDMSTPCDDWWLILTLFKVLWAFTCVFSSLSFLILPLFIECVKRALPLSSVDDLFLIPEVFTDEISSLVDLLADAGESLRYAFTLAVLHTFLL